MKNEFIEARIERENERINEGRNPPTYFHGVSKTRWDVCISSYQFWQAADHRLLLKYGKGFSRSLSLSLSVSPSLSLYLSLSLSLQAHTRCHSLIWDPGLRKMAKFQLWNVTFQSLFPKCSVGLCHRRRRRRRRRRRSPELDKLWFLITEKSIPAFPEFPWKSSFCAVSVNLNIFRIP